MFRKKKKPVKIISPGIQYDEKIRRLKEEAEKEMKSYSAEFIVPERYLKEVSEKEIREKLAGQIAEELEEDMLISKVKIRDDEVISYRAKVLVDTRSLKRSKYDGSM